MIYWNHAEIPIPDSGYINHNNGRVFIFEKDVSGKKHQKDIGHATSETTMHPNDYFRQVFPSEWEKYYGTKNSPPREMSLGLYALCLGAATSYNLYTILQDVYGPQYGNAIMDYCMFSLTERLNVTQVFQDRMSEEVLFSKEAYSDRWYSEFFEKLDKDKHFDFKTAWIKECVKRGIRDTWLCIDGSNIDCCVKGSDLCEFGAAKSHNKSKTIVSYIYAVSAVDGLPISYVVNNGSMVDNKAIQELVELMAGYGFRIQGVIVDRGFCYPAVIDLLERMKVNYVVTLMSDLTGFKQMYADHGETIRWKAKYAVDKSGIFGIGSEEPMTLWKSSRHKMYVNLYFNCASGSIQAGRLIREIMTQMEHAQDDIKCGRKPSVKKELSKYFNVQDDTQPYAIEFNYDNWDAAMSSKGFFAYGTSEPYGAQKAYKLSRLRDASETQYSIMKSQEGYQATRVHTTPRMLSKHSICFITSIIRHAIMKACQREDLDTNVMLQKMKRIRMIMVENGTYTFVRNLTTEQKELFGEFGLEQEDFLVFTREVNNRLVNPIVSQTHKMPVHEPVVKKGRGRPKGSRNKKTIEKAETQSYADGATLQRTKRGRPVGSKDTVTRKKRADAGKKRGPNIRTTG